MVPTHGWEKAQCELREHSTDELPMTVILTPWACVGKPVEQRWGVTVSGGVRAGPWNEESVFWLKLNNGEANASWVVVKDLENDCWVLVIRDLGTVVA